MVRDCFQRSCAWTPREELRVAQSRAIAIRKLLKTFQHRGDQGREEMDDAVQLAETIEHLARFGQSCAAEEAVEIASQVEVLSSMLRAEVDGLLAS